MWPVLLKVGDDLRKWAKPYFELAHYIQVTLQNKIANPGAVFLSFLFSFGIEGIHWFLSGVPLGNKKGKGHEVIHV